MSLENKLITADIIEAQEFPSLARQHNVTAVPKTIINNTLQFNGNLSEPELLEKVMQIGYRDPKSSSEKDS